MGLLSDSHYALFEDNIVSVRIWSNFKDEYIHAALWVNGLVVDSCKHEATTLKGGSLSGTITRANGNEFPIRVDIKMSWTSSSCVLLVEGNQIPLTKSTDAKIKEKIKSHGHDFQEYQDSSIAIEAAEVSANLVEEVRAKLVEAEKLKEAKAQLTGIEKMQRWGRKLIIFAVSLALFAAAFFVWFDDLPPGDITIFLVGLVVAIFIHEAGHLAGMKIFGYRNLNVFFIPFFGAGASGEKEGAPRWQEAAVSLMGPVPGLLLALLIPYIFTGPAIFTGSAMSSEILGLFWITLLVLNAFNLLPIMPLDGGRFLEDTLFCRNPYAKTGFTLVSATLLLGGGFVIGDYVLKIVGAILAITLPHSFKTARILSKIRKANINVAASAKELSDDDLSRILEHLRPLNTPKDYADGVRNIISHSKKPPSIGATIILFSVYLLSFYLIYLSAIKWIEVAPY